LEEEIVIRDITYENLGDIPSFGKEGFCRSYPRLGSAQLRYVSGTSITVISSIVRCYRPSAKRTYFQ